MVSFVFNFPSCACKWQKLSCFNEPSIVSRFLPSLMAMNYQHLILHGRKFFQEPHQIIHLGVVEGFIWFTSFNLFDRKYVKIYHMVYLTCLFLKLMHYIVFGGANQWVKPPLVLIIPLKINIFKLAHGHFYENMENYFNV